ncbi:MAG: hypothetical protein IPJ25_09730 [Rhodocyclaceae bacterium]|nr:hypothetical protein [Rhodocyclaceae bacterium]
MTSQAQDVKSKRITRDVPESWGMDRLSQYLETAERNTIATFANNSDTYTKFSEIDVAFRTLTHGLTDTPEWFESFFLLRAHSAFLTSVRLAIAGHVTETYATSRQAIEFALYGYFLFKNPELRDVWLNRTESDGSRKLVRKTFKNGEMLEKVIAEIPQHGEAARDLYEWTIDYGAHPNESSITTTAQLIKEGDSRILAASICMVTMFQGTLLSKQLPKLASVFLAYFKQFT